MEIKVFMSPGRREERRRDGNANPKGVFQVLALLGKKVREKSHL